MGQKYKSQTHVVINLNLNFGFLHRLQRKLLQTHECGIFYLFQYLGWNAVCAWVAKWHSVDIWLANRIYGSAFVSVRVGICQPGVQDYECGTNVDVLEWNTPKINSIYCGSTWIMLSIGWMLTSFKVSWDRKAKFDTQTTSKIPKTAWKAWTVAAFHCFVWVNLTLFKQE